MINSFSSLRSSIGAVIGTIGVAIFIVSYHCVGSSSILSGSGDVGKPIGATAYVYCGIVGAARIPAEVGLFTGKAHHR